MPSTTTWLVLCLDFAWHSCHVELPMVEATILGIAAWPDTKTHGNSEWEAKGDSHFSGFSITWGWVDCRGFMPPARKLAKMIFMPVKRTDQKGKGVDWVHEVEMDGDGWSETDWSSGWALVILCLRRFFLDGHVEISFWYGFFLKIQMFQSQWHTQILIEQTYTVHKHVYYIYISFKTCCFIHRPVWFAAWNVTPGRGVGRCDSSIALGALELGGVFLQRRLRGLGSPDGRVLLLRLKENNSTGVRKVEFFFLGCFQNSGFVPLFALFVDVGIVLLMLQGPASNGQYLSCCDKQDRRLFVSKTATSC